MTDTTHTTHTTRQIRTLTLVWMSTLLAVFILMITLGITMRLAQGSQVALSPVTFYAVMTMHGLGMVGTLFAAGMVIIWYIVAQTCRPSLTAAWVSFALFLIGAVMLLVATLLGHFGAGWYALYPLPFVNPVWPSWATGMAIIGLMTLGVSWLVLPLDLLRAMAVRYGAGRLLAWDSIRGNPESPIPASILIATMCAIAGALGALVGAATLMMYLFKWFAPATTFDPLLLKNMMFMFGHIIVNVTIYCGVAAIYYLLPTFTKRPWKVNRITAIAWNATLFFVLFAYLHHLYMDFAQPTSLQVFGQVASYGSAVPATAVTMFGVASQVYRSGIRWSFTPLAFAAGIVGWAIGGIAAVVDSTIMVNSRFHNTLWVPAHFHTYFLVGFVLMLLGFLHHLVSSRAERLAGISLATMLVGGYGFLLMFYLGGINGVPRRYSDYKAFSFGTIGKTATSLATYGAIFASVFLLGILGFSLALVLGRRRTQAAKAEVQTATG